MSNDFLQFCPTDTGTNLLDNGDYDIDTDRTSGNKPGVARSRLVNKALRQANFITSQVAQAVADYTGTNVTDDTSPTPTKFLAQLNALLLPLPPVISKYASGSGSHNLAYTFFIVTGSASAGATYTNNAITFTVKETISSGLRLIATGSGAPTASGTLTKSGGSGDSSIVFRAVRTPQYLKATLVGGGGGGGGGSASGGTGGTGGNTTFGTTLLVANGGVGGVGNAGTGGAGGTASLGSGPVGTALSGGTGSPGAGTTDVLTALVGGSGAVSPFGGAGTGGYPGNAGEAGITNSGSGGGGGSVSGGNNVGSGGGAGGYVNAFILAPLSTYAYAVGAAGTAGSAGAGAAGGVGGSGVVIVEEYYQ